MILGTAVTSLFIASSSLGGAILTGPTGNQPWPATITLSLSDVTSPINGIDIYPVGLPLGKVLVIGMEKVNPVLCQTINPNIPVPTAAAPVDLASFADWGVRSPNAANGTSVNGPLLTLHLAMAPGVALWPFTLRGYWADTNFDEGEAGTVTIGIPEPAGLLLFTSVGAFWARRRARIAA